MKQFQEKNHTKS